MIAELAGALSAVVQGRQIHTDEREPPHWRGLGLLVVILGIAAVIWLLHKHKGVLFQ